MPDKPWLEWLHRRLLSVGDSALADVPGLLERMDIPQLRALWPEVEVTVRAQES